MKITNQVVYSVLAINIAVIRSDLKYCKQCLTKSQIFNHIAVAITPITLQDVRYWFGHNSQRLSTPLRNFITPSELIYKKQQSNVYRQFLLMQDIHSCLTKSVLSHMLFNSWFQKTKIFAYKLTYNKI